MQGPSGDIRSILAYLQEMARYCREERRIDLAREYDEAISLVCETMFGKLPPRKQISYYQSSVPNVEVNLEASAKTRSHQIAWKLASFVDDSPAEPPSPSDGIRVKTSECPLRKIIGRFYKRINGRPVPYERLACGHEQFGPIGHEILRDNRRCRRCRQEQLYAIAQKKKPGAVTLAKSKAVGA